MPKPLRVVAAAWRRGDRFLACRRGERAAQGGYWELPGGKVEAGESDQQALARELAEELDAVVRVESPVGETTHAYPELTIHLLAYWCSGVGEPVALEHAELRWVDAEEARGLNWAPADRPLVAKVARVLGGLRAEQT